MVRKEVILDKSDVKILTNISKEKEITIYQLAKDSDIAYKNLLRRLNNYYEHNWVERKEDTNKDNRKVVLLSLTEKGKNFLMAYMLCDTMNTTEKIKKKLKIV